jgi:acyl-CoA thioesterase
MARVMTFAEILAAARPADAGLTAAVPEDWMQGRTSYGGLSSALAMVAAQRVAGEGLPPLRSATINFIGPLAGEVVASARLLRQGRNATWIAAEVSGEAGIGLTATFVFMGAVESKLHLNEAAPPAGLLAVDEALPLNPHGNPGFTQHFERRYALPKPDAPRPEIAWWVRLREGADGDGGLDPMVALLLTADALPPGVMPLMGGWSPVSSMTWLINLLTPAPTTRDGWWLLRAAGSYAENGCSSQDMAIWNADGVPIASGMQSVAIFG